MNKARIELIKAAQEKINAEREDEKELNFEDIEQLTKAQQKWIEED